MSDAMTLRCPGADTTYISAKLAVSVYVRGVKQPWLAQLVGKNKKWKFDRRFVKRRHRVRGVCEFIVPDHGVYEFRNFRTESAGRTWSGYCKIHKDGRVEQIEEEQVLSEIQDVVTRLADIGKRIEAEEAFRGPCPPTWNGEKV